jgi:hypothetical protein
MDDQLIISLDKKVIEKAKRYAEANHRSLNHLIESYLKSLSEDGNHKTFEVVEISEFVRNMQSGVQIPEDIDYMDLKYK